MERISIFNYEAFYLDFLEGNLNEEDTALLMTFLEDNPDLKLEDEELPSFNEEEINIDVKFKSNLKQPEASEEITIENVEYFMIANAEGLLNVTKQNELDEFIVSNNELEKDRKIYNLVHFEPDASVIYNNKESLKRKTVVLWPYVASVAAIFVIAFLLVWSSMEGPVERLNNNILAEETNKVDDNSNDQNSTLSNNDVVIVEDTPIIENDISSNINNNTPQNREDVERSEKSIGKMERIPVGNVLTALSNQKLEPISSPTFVKQNEKNQEGSQALASVNINDQMENPIEPITNFLSDKTNTEIDFQRTKKETDPKKGKGFFIKIGKFEFSRKKH